MFTADAALEFGTYGATFLDGHADELADPFLVEHLEGIDFEDLLLKIDGEEAGDVVARITEGHLREVVRTEREVFGTGGDAVGCEGSTRNFDHRTHLEVYAHAFFGEEFGGRVADHLLLAFEFVENTGEGNHDFGMRIETFLLQFDSGTEDGTRLHGGDFGIGVAETATAVTEHGVGLNEGVDALANVFDRDAHGFGHFFLTGLIVGYEFVERGIEQADIDGFAVHGTEDAEEVGFLVRQDLLKRLFASFGSFAENHFAHGNDLLGFEEHVFRAAKSDTHGAEFGCDEGVLRRIGVGAHLQTRILGAEIHQFCEVSAEFGSFGGDFAGIHATSRTVERDEIAFFEREPFDLHGAFLVVDDDAAGSGNTAFTHTARYDSSVRRHTAARREDTFCGCHTGEVFGRGFDAYHDHFLTSGVPFFGIVGVEYDLATSGTGRSGQTAGDFFGTGQSTLIEYGVEKFVELVGFATLDGGFLVDEAFVEEIHGDLHHGRTRTLTVARLEEPEFAFLHRELHVLHVAIVLFELVLEAVELLIDFRHGLFHRGEFGGALFFADAGAFSPALRSDFCDLLRRADTGYHVFTLCIDEVLAVEQVFAATGVTAEAYTRCRGFAHVTEYHGLHVDGRTPFVGNGFHLTIKDGAFVHPAAEHSADGSPKLFVGIGGEVVSGLLLDGGLEAFYQVFQLFNGEIFVEMNAANGLHFFDDGFEGIDVLFVFGLHAEHDVAVHLYETTIGVVDEVGVARFGRQAGGNFVVETEV